MSDKTNEDASSKQRIRKIVGWGTEMAGGAVGGALGFLLAGPAGAAVAGAGASAITKAFGWVGEEICDRFLSPREKVRIGAALAIAADTTRARLAHGDTPRQDSFVDDGTDHPPIEEVTEGLLMAAQRAYDEKRVPYIGRLSGNLNFRSDLGVAASTWLVRLTNDISYTQLCMLRLAFENIKGIPLTDGKVQQKRTNGPQHAAYLSEILKLFQAGLVNFGSAPIWSILDIDPPNMRLQGFGVHLYDLMVLSDIPDSDLDPIRLVFSHGQSDSPLPS
ncbi:MAG: hypothetical protein WCY11_07015 [Novosphingobium sp.]